MTMSQDAKDRTAKALVGKTIKSVEWSSDSDGSNGYWVMTFDDDSEICWNRMQAEVAIAPAIIPTRPRTPAPFTVSLSVTGAVVDACRHGGLNAPDDTVKKRYFLLDDDYAWYVVVATDLDHARKIITDSGIEFGDPSVPLPEAEKRDGLVWSEFTPEDATKNNVMLDDGRRVSLTECALGDWFCSEY